MDAASIFMRSPSSYFRVEFENGDIFVLTQLRDCSESAEQALTWVGKIVDSENLSEKRRRLHSKGNYLQFCLSDVCKIDAAAN
jgi:hypothetical protein